MNYKQKRSFCYHHSDALGYLRNVKLCAMDISLDTRHSQKSNRGIPFSTYYSYAAPSTRSSPPKEVVILVESL